MLQFLSSIAGTPSGPLAEDGRSSLMASIISSGVMLISCIVCDTFGFRNCGSGDGLLKTESYWSANNSAISFESVVMFFVALFSRGPMFVFTFLFWLP